MGTYENIDLTRANPLLNRFDIFSSPEAGYHLNFDWPIDKSILKRTEMLLGKEGGGYQHGDLFLILNRNEGGPHGYFRLPEPHVAAYQPVHDSIGTHVIFDGFNSRRLIGCFFKGKPSENDSHSPGSTEQAKPGRASRRA